MDPHHAARTARPPRPSAATLALTLFAAAAMSALAAQPAPPTAAGETPATAPVNPIARRPLNVVVTIAPLRGLVEGLLPPGSSLTVLVPPGVSEHGYEIPPASLARLARADIVVKIGAGLEPQVEKFLSANPRATRNVIVLEATAHAHEHADDAAAAKDNDENASHAPAEKAADPAHAHNHDGPGHSCSVCGTHESDPHLWLNPAHAAALTRAVARAVMMRHITPEMLGSRSYDDVIDERLAAWPALHAQLARIDRIDTAYRETLAGAKRRTIIVAHDAFGEIERRYNIRAVAIAGLHAGEPTPAAIRQAIETIRAEGLTTVFIEPQLSPRAAKRIAETTGARVDALDPLGTGDWFALMESNLAVLAKALDAPTPKVSPAE